MITLVLLLSSASAQTFTDGTAKWVPTGLGGSQAHWADLDGDGLPELHDSGIVYQNTGSRLDRWFALPTYYLGGWADVDNDGDTDFVAWTGNGNVYLNELDTTGGFTADPNTVDLGIVSCLGVSLGDFDGDGWVDAYYTGYEGAGYEPDAITYNEGGWFESVGWVENNATMSPGRGVTSADFDEDGDLDIYVSNYRLERNHLYVNDGTGGFSQQSVMRNVAGVYDGWGYSYGHTIGSAWGDLDDDGHLDLFVGNFSHIQPYQDRPQFLRNKGPAGHFRFADLTGVVGLPWQESFASPALGDYDNDGDLDLYFTTVYGGDYPVLMRNDGNWTFTDVTAAEGLSGIASTYQAAFADVDDDGDLDLVTGGRLFINQTTGMSWLKVVLSGDGGLVNSSAIGAQARITLGGDTLTRQVEAGTGQGNQNDLTLHFGLGTHTDPVEIEVFWPDGTTVTYGPYDVEQTVEIAL